MARKDKEILTKKHIARLERERRQSKIIQWVAIVIVAFIVIGGIVTAFWQGALAIGKFDINYVRRNQPIITLGDQTVTTHEFQNYVRLQRNMLIGQYFQYQQYQQYFGMDLSAQISQIQSQLDATSAETIGQATVDQLVEIMLIQQEATKRNITVSEAEIDNFLQDAFGYFPNGTPIPSFTPTEPVFSTLSPEQLKLVSPTPTITETPSETVVPTAAETLVPLMTLTPDLTTTATPTLPPTATVTFTPSPTNTAVPTITPTSAPAPTATPYTQEGYQKTITDSLVAYKNLGFSEAEFRTLVMQELLRKKVQEAITADLKPFSEDVWARHILVADEATAKSVRERLLNGEDFATVAAEVSQDTNTKDTGGDLGWFAMGSSWGPTFDTAAFSLSIGEISQPINSNSGWHIIQVLGHENRPLTTDAFSQLKDTAFTNWLAKAKSDATSSGLLVIFDYWKQRIPLTPTIQDYMNTPTPTP